MKVLVTGAAGHLGEALMRTLPSRGFDPVGIDLRDAPFVHMRGSVADRDFVQRAMRGVGGVVHAATLHKPHVATHSKRDFVEANVTGTLTLLEAAAAEGARRFVFTSTTSAFGDALRPAPGAPAAWIDEEAPSVPKNIYGATKTAAEILCGLFVREGRLACLILRTSRFFPEEDDDAARRAAFSPENAKANEFLHRRVDLGDAAEAHALALEKAEEIGFARYVVSATTPFGREDLKRLRVDPAGAIADRAPRFAEIYAKAGFRPPDDVDRVYVNAKARAELGWRPEYDFARVLGQIEAGEPIGGQMAREVGAKGYHDRAFDGDGPYPVA
ncbi:MAG: NAD(P)-dependent oxidoreductase [Pseudomonadota bacterium]